jgi:type IV pilus assembly protein PilE
MSRSRSAAGGFTLIELMVTVAIVAILAAAALYAYQGAQRKNRRAAAEALLGSIAQQEQQYFIDNRAYAVIGTTLTSIDNVTDALGLSRIATQPTVANFFTVSVTCNPPPPATCSTQPSFYISATPLSGTPQVKDYTLVILSDGTRYAYPNGSTTSQTGVW